MMSLKSLIKATVTPSAVSGACSRANALLQPIYPQRIGRTNPIFATARRHPPLTLSVITGPGRRTCPAVFIRDQFTARTAWKEVMLSPEQRHRQLRQTIPDVAKSEARFGRTYSQSSITSCGGARDGGSIAASGCRTFAPTCARIFARVCPSLWASPLPLNVDDTLIEDDRLYLLMRVAA